MLMHRRWLMHTTGNRLEIMYADSIRIFATIPTYYIKWVISVPNRIHHTSYFGIDDEFTFFVYWCYILRLADIALTEWRMLQQLAVAAQITFRESNRTERIYNEQAVIFCVELNLINTSSRDDQIIAITESDVSVLRFKGTFSFVHKNHFISIRVFKESITAETLSWCRQCDMHIIIKQHYLSGT